ncbi:MAG: PAS domain S-box protein [Thermoplasmata archaeon]
MTGKKHKRKMYTARTKKKTKIGITHNLSKELKLVGALKKTKNKCRELEQSLSESRKRFDTIFNSGPHGMVFMDTKYNFIRVNDKVCQMLGYPKNELLSLKFTDITYPDTLEVDVLHAKKLLNGEIPYYRTEKRYITKNKDTLWANITVLLVRDGKGKPLYFISTIEDISKRKLTEEAFHNQHDKTKKYLDIAGAILVVIGPDQKVTLINKTGCDILGFAEAEITGKNWFDNFIPHRVREDVRSLYINLINDKVGAAEHFRNPVLTRNGEERIIRWHNVILKDGEGGIIGTLSSGEDVTERESVEEALQESEERYRRLVDMSPETIAVHSEGKLLYLNPAGLKLIGASTSDDVIGKSIWDIVHPDSHELVRKRVTQALKDGKTVPLVEEKFVSLDGKAIIGEVTTTPIVYEGEKALLTVIRDITKRRNAEEC